MARLWVRLLSAITSIASFSGPALAEFGEARSKHFIVIGTGSTAALRDRVVELEKYFFMLRAMTRMKEQTNPIPITIYLVGGVNAVGKTIGIPNSGVAGYYTATIRGPMAVSTSYDVGNVKEGGLSGRQVLFHELAHHFMAQYFPASYPTWYTEGFADYYGSARILPNDIIEVGHGIANRYRAFAYNDWFHVGKMLAVRNYSDAGNNVFLLYSEGWLLTHYLSFNRARSGQLSAYLGAINAGKSYEAARDAAFGPGATALNSELRAYSRRHGLSAITLPFKTIDPGPVALRMLDESEQALIPVNIALARRPSPAEAALFARKMTALAASFPRDPRVWRAAVETHRAAGDDAAAATALNRWLELAPTDGMAILHRGDLRLSALAAAGSRDKAAWQAARDDILTAIRTTRADPQTLVAYHRSFTAEGVLPPPGAQNGLFAALEKVPQDDRLRYRVARDFEARGMIAEAIDVIRVAAYELHDSATADDSGTPAGRAREPRRLAGDVGGETARQMLDRLQARMPVVPQAAP